MFSLPWFNIIKMIFFLTNDCILQLKITFIIKGNVYSALRRGREKLLFLCLFLNFGFLLFTTFLKYNYAAYLITDYVYVENRVSFTISEM